MSASSKNTVDNLKSVFSNIKLENNKFFSVELCSNINFDVNSLSVTNPLFYSVTWHDHVTSIGDKAIKTTNPAMLLATKLAALNKNILLNLPCRYLNKKQAFDILNTAQQNGIKNIFAILGDPIKSPDVRESTDFSHAIDLVRYIRKTFGNAFSVGVAAYPQSTSDLHLEYLKEKVDAGADFIITQLIFDPEIFLKFCQRCQDFGIEIPIIPEICVFKSYNQFKKVVEICNLKIPNYMQETLNSLKDDNEEVLRYVLNWTAEMIKNLLINNDYSVLGVHICSFNNTEIVQKVYESNKCLQ